MAVLSSVFDSLRSMTLMQLLLAYMACAGYSLVQGHLLGSRGRRLAWAGCGVGAGGFALASADWVNAVILVAFAAAAFGAFVGAVWLMSRALGLMEASGSTWSTAAAPIADLPRPFAVPTSGLFPPHP